MTARLRDLAHFARHHLALTIAAVLMTCVAGLLFAGVDSATWLTAFVGLGVVYVGLALIDLRDQFRRRTD